MYRWGAENFGLAARHMPMNIAETLNKHSATFVDQLAYVIHSILL